MSVVAVPVPPCPGRVGGDHRLVVTRVIDEDRVYARCSRCGLLVRCERDPNFGRLS